jgi:hypothetical protein
LLEVPQRVEVHIGRLAEAAAAHDRTVARLIDTRGRCPTKRTAAAPTANASPTCAAKSPVCSDATLKTRCGSICAANDSTPPGRHRSPPGCANDTI